MPLLLIPFEGFDSLKVTIESILRVTFFVVLCIMLSGLRRLQKKSLDLYIHDPSNNLFLLFLK